MEQPEEKKRKANRRQSISTSPFPTDLTSEILLRLPEKSLVRFRCVSKLWLSITTDPYFMNSFEAQNPRPSLLVCCKEGDTLFVFSIPQHRHHTLRNPNISYSSSQPINRYYINSPKLNNFSCTESVHGLICLHGSSKTIVWNPSTKQLLTLPEPRKSWDKKVVLLGYDPVEGKHKLVCLPYERTSGVCRVLTLASAEESWRTVKTIHKHRSGYHTSGRCIKGVIFYIAYIFEMHDWVIMSFDVRSEKFNMIQLPSDINKDVLITYEGKLACIEKDVVLARTNILWILEDVEEHKWSRKDIVSPFGYFETTFHVKGFTHNGEFVLVPPTFKQSSYILFLDPVKNGYRRFELKGIAEDNSRLNNAVANGHVIMLHAFPNHIESQMSL